MRLKPILFIWTYKLTVSFLINPDLSKSGDHFLFFSLSSTLSPFIIHLFLIINTNSVMTSTYFTIAFTIDTLLSSYNPLIPWLAIRQNNRIPIRLGDIIGFEHAHGPAFRAQPFPMYGHICGISHFVQGFVIVMASMDPQTFKALNSTIYIAIPRQWIILPFKSALIYRFSYRSLPTPRFLHLLDPSHGVYQSDRLEEHLEGSRTVKKV